MGRVLPLRRKPDPEDAPSDADLVLAARAGDDTARDALYRRHARMVLGLAHRVLGGGDEVDDLVQDVFLAAFSSLDGLADPQSFAKWIATITVRTARSRIRRRSVARRIGLVSRSAPEADRIVSPDCPTDVAAELRLLYEVLERLEVNTRVALVLRRVEGMTLPEIAEHLGVSLATVKRRVRAGESKLRLHRGPRSQGGGVS